jgi:hypothetical protein
MPDKDVEAILSFSDVNVTSPFPEEGFEVVS